MAGIEPPRLTSVRETTRTYLQGCSWSNTASRFIPKSVALVKFIFMERSYDIFEMVKNEAIWRQAVTGHEAAIQALKELATKTKNELRVLHLPTKSIVATLNCPLDSNN